MPHPLALAGAAALALATGSAAPPAPCTVAQITDAAGDGHHTSSDVLSAWLSEASGRLQAVIKVTNGLWQPEHSDETVNGSGFAFLFGTGGRTWFVRLTAPPPGAGPPAYDYGTYTRAGGFVSLGATAGSVEYGPGGTATLDVPPATGAVAGATLAAPFVLTYDGITNGVPDWVDHAPGGDGPDDPSVGADYRVGACTAAPPVSTGPAPVTAVELSATRRLTGGGTATVRGRVVPARAGIRVTLTRTARTARVTTVTTAAGGTFSARVPVQELTHLRAVAEGVGSETVTVAVRSTVRIAVRRLRSGAAEVRGRVRPDLPGRVLWLRTTSPTPAATRPVSHGRFTLRLEHPRPGRYQAVFIPSHGRAERSTSTPGVIR